MGTHRELLRFLVLRGEVTTLSAPLPSSAPSRGRRGLTSRVTFASEEANASADRTDPSEGSRRRFGGRGPSSKPVPRTSFVVRAVLREAEPLARFACTGWFVQRERGTSHRIGPRFPHRPAKGDALRRRPRCVPPPCPCVIARIAPRFRASGPPLHAAPVPRRTPTLCRRREPAPFLPPAMPGMTSQASGAARSNGTKGWLLPPFRALDRSAQDGFRDRRCPRRDVPRTS
jgi:hypothetical protein